MSIQKEETNKVDLIQLALSNENIRNMLRWTRYTKQNFKFFEDETLDYVEEVNKLPENSDAVKLLNALIELTKKLQETKELFLIPNKQLVVYALIISAISSLFLAGLALTTVGAVVGPQLAVTFFCLSAAVFMITLVSAIIAGVVCSKIEDTRREAADKQAYTLRDEVSTVFEQLESIQPDTCIQNYKNQEQVFWQNP